MFSLVPVAKVTSLWFIPIFTVVELNRFVFVFGCSAPGGLGGTTSPLSGAGLPLWAPPGSERHLGEGRRGGPIQCKS